MSWTQYCKANLAWFFWNFCFEFYRKFGIFMHCVFFLHVFCKTIPSGKKWSKSKCNTLNSSFLLFSVMQISLQVQCWYRSASFWFCWCCRTESLCVSNCVHCMLCIDCVWLVVHWYFSLPCNSCLVLCAVCAGLEHELMVLLVFPLTLSHISR